MTCYTWEMSTRDANTHSFHTNSRPVQPLLPDRRKHFFRLVLISLTIAFILSFSFIVSANAGGNNSANTRMDGHAIIDVGAGETLWSIASEHADGRNMKRYIRDLKELNELESNTLQIGQILYLP